MPPVYRSSSTHHPPRPPIPMDVFLINMMLYQLLSSGSTPTRATNTDAAIDADRFCFIHFFIFFLSFTISDSDYHYFASEWIEKKIGKKVTSKQDKKLCNIADHSILSITLIFYLVLCNLFSYQYKKLSLFLSFFHLAFKLTDDVSNSI